MSNSLSTDDIGLLYAQHYPWLVRWLHRKLGSSHDAADFAQDTFCRLLGSQAPVLREPRAWLTTTATRLIIDDSRSRMVARLFCESWVHVHGNDTAPSAETVAQAAQTLALVSRWLETLPPRARMAFLMVRLEGQTHAQVAAHLGVSVSRVRQYLSASLVQCYKLAFSDAGVA
ncbi:sigma-70 family RNA polymerase sigma factor [Advenella kashmirensis]